MQHPIDGIYHNVTMTGVPVTLTALDANGNYQDIGTAITDPYYGTFSKTWAPPIEGDYKIIASFTGDDSYGSSAASTAISVGAPVATSTAIHEVIVPDYTMTIVAAALAIIIAFAIGIAIAILLLRKRQ